MNAAQRMALAAAVGSLALPAAAAADINEPIVVTRPDIAQITPVELVERLPAHVDSPYEVNITHSSFVFESGKSVIKDVLSADIKAAVHFGGDDVFDLNQSFVKPYTESARDYPNEIAQRLFSGVDGVFPYANEDRLTLNFGAAAEPGEWAPELTLMWNDIMPESEVANASLRDIKRPDQADFAFVAGARYTF